MPDVLGGFVFHVKGRASASAASGVGRGKGLAFAQAVGEDGMFGQAGRKAVSRTPPRQTFLPSR